ncbi:MAG: hypothetical protein ACE5K0_06935 [Candidatus Methanofastidiosia archaeon]
MYETIKKMRGAFENNRKMKRELFEKYSQLFEEKPSEMKEEDFLESQARKFTKIMIELAETLTEVARDERKLSEILETIEDKGLQSHYLNEFNLSLIKLRGDFSKLRELMWKLRDEKRDHLLFLSFLDSMDNISSKLDKNIGDLLEILYDLSHR